MGVKLSGAFGSFTGGLKTGTPLIRYSVAFDGVDDYLSLEDSNLLVLNGYDFTVEYWVKFNNTTTDMSLFDFRPSETNGSYPHMSVNSSLAGPGKIMWYTSSFNLQSGTLSAGTWYHVAVCRSSGSTRLYIDGVQADSGSDSLNYQKGNRYIGRDSFSGGFFDGNISNFRMMTTPLYTSNFTPPTSDLTAVPSTVFLDLQSETLVDNSGNDINITAFGGASVSTDSPF